MRKDNLGEAMRAYTDKCASEWVTDCCEQDDNAESWTYAALVYVSFEKWQRDHNNAPVSRKALCLALERAGYTRWKIGGWRVFRGLSVNGCAGEEGQEMAESVRAKNKIDTPWIPSPLNTGLSWRERSQIRSRLPKDAQGKRIYPTDWPYDWR